MRKHFGKIIYLSVLVILCGFAINSYQVAKHSNKLKQQADNELIIQSKKTNEINNGHNSPIIYLAPKGIKAQKDHNAEIINNLLQKTFKYNSPKAFYTQAKYLQPRVEGPFYDYWFGNGIKQSYETLVNQARGSKYTRNWRDLYLTKKADLHYFAVVSTYTRDATDQNTTPIPKYYALDITWNKKTNKWHFDYLPNVSPQ